ncbi:hypothetical protein V502_04173 [Pseudogymnoascus sp. VKM F-4520 (FW-2644)]|nr:hypothetical protein V502_04173 [Pseudogymnoascus sp. VKM F-4520 (FW-2644)]
MAYNIDISVFQISDVTKHWWQLFLSCILLTSAAVGVSYVGVNLIQKALRLLKLQWRNHASRRQTSRVKKHFQRLNTTSIVRRLAPEVHNVNKPTSFRIYLGAFDGAALEARSRILSDCDLVVLDPLQAGVGDSISSIPCNKSAARFILGRLDLADIFGEHQYSLIPALDHILGLVSVYFPLQTEERHGFTGIVLACWEGFFSVATLHELSKELVKRGLDVYLEAKPPTFLDEVSAVAHESISGLVIRNGLLWPNGERKDCFDLEALRPAARAFMSQEFLRPFLTIMWEEIDDDAVMPIAVLKRTHSWSKYHTTLLSVVPSGALFDAEAAVPQLEPLGAFDWLKDRSVIELQTLWQDNQTVSSESTTREVFKPLRALIPALDSMWQENTCDNCGSSKECDNDPELAQHEAEWIRLNCSSKFDTISISESGLNFDRKGCFPIGINITAEDFAQVVQSQSRLRKLHLLDGVSSRTLRNIGFSLGDFVQSKLLAESVVTPQTQNVILELSRNLTGVLGSGLSGIRVYQGLDSGFHATGHSRFWGVYSGGVSCDTDIYISTKSEDMIGTMLHTYLSSRGCPRRQCFEAEYVLAEWSSSLSQCGRIPKRVQQDVESLSPSEGLILLQQLTLYDSPTDSAFVRGVREEVEAQLIKQPSKAQLKKICMSDYLGGSIDAEGVVSSRIGSHCQHGLRHPTKSGALQLFANVESSIKEILRTRRATDLELITATLLHAMKNSHTDTVVDTFALAVFCTMRKLAFEEIYIEVTDRNPLFNDQPDQGGVFAELFALGSRCETYFDMSPSSFGKLMLSTFREQYSNPLRQPPLYKEASAALQTAFAESRIDIAPPSSTTAKMPAYQNFTFMGVFAIPALIDVLMLTMTSHGLYFSGSMGKSEQKYANIAFMLSLPLSGAIGTWIACGGTYYLASMAFSALNYFVFTRLLGGFVFLLSTAIVGFIAISCVIGVEPALVFFLYFVALTSYLSLLATLANYNLNGLPFQSGRKVIVLCVPVLFVSPLVTIFVQGYDTQVYLSVLYFFVALVLVGTRHIASLWATWFLKIETIDDKALKEWYLERTRNVALEKLSEPAILIRARQDLLHEVTKAVPGLFKFRTTNDVVVLKLAKCFEATSVMMVGLPKPVPFSSTWNVQSKVALKQLGETQRGIRFHNGFFHWRQAGDEVGCTILYFVIALLDKWIALIGGWQSINGQESGNEQLGFTSTNTEFRYAIGFGIAYYLIGAVLLDYNAQKLNELAAKCKQDIITDDDCLRHAIKARSRERTALYWKTLRRYLFLHMWSLAITSILMLLFSSSEDAIVLFLIYVLAYSGLLLYQFTKTFSGIQALKPLLISVSLGITVGYSLRFTLPSFKYSDVIALAVGTWTLAMLSLWAVRIDNKTPNESIKVLCHGYHGFYSAGQDPAWSQSELQLKYNLIRSLPDDQHPRLDPESYQGQQVNLIFAAASLEQLSDTAKKAFPLAKNLFESSLRAFNDGKIVVEVFSIEHLDAQGQSTRAISFVADDHVRILVACDTTPQSTDQLLSKGCVYNIADIVLHAVAEIGLEYSHRHASLSENLLRGTAGPDLRMPHSFKCEAIRTKLDIAELTSKTQSHYKIELLQNLCLGVDPDLKWNNLPEQIRRHLVQRCLGQSNSLAEGHFSPSAIAPYIQLTSNESDFDIHVARCNYGAYMSALFYRESAIPSSRASMITLPPTPSTLEESKTTSPTPFSPAKKPSLVSALRTAVGYIWHATGTMVKFFAVALVADVEYQRELHWSLADSPRFIRGIVKVILDGAWVVAKTTQEILLPFFLFHNRKNVASLWRRINGRKVSFKRNSINIQTSDGQYTGFVHHNDDGSFNLRQYRGVHSSEPESRDKLSYVNKYSEKISLLRREELRNGEVINIAEYDYQNLTGGDSKRFSRLSISGLPIARRVIDGQDKSQLINYNRQGLVESGSYFKDGNLIRFRYHYRGMSKLDGEILRAEFVLPHLSCTVSWCAPRPRQSDPLDKWVSCSDATEATFVVGREVWESVFTYDHRCHRIITTTLNGTPVETPPMIEKDYLNILQKPKRISFLDDNPLYSFKTIRPNPVSRYMGLHTRRYPYLTSQSRYLLWEAWKNDRDYDGVVVRWMDERLLRRDAVLKPYWRKRDWGNLASAGKYLERNGDAIATKTDLDTIISSWSPLAIKMNDLRSLGPGGDAAAHTKSKLASQKNEDRDALHVIAVDTGTWPNEGGGVSACRRDVINNLNSIKWHMVVETANDFGLPIHQLEKNVHSLKMVPLWGLDMMTPTHGLFQNRLDSEVRHIPRHTDLIDIKENFVPVLAALVWGARSLELEISDIKQMTRALVNLNAYFTSRRYPWSVVWNSKVVKNAWRRLWLSKVSDNVRPCSAWFATELPTLDQLDQGLELWSRYLFIFSIPVPDEMPDVFQASHHSVSASYGIICKLERQCTLQIWDHAISWRESNLNLSSALCSLAPFVRNSLLGLLRLSSVLTLHHADTILPCADFFNPNWEVEIGTCEGSIEHRNTFRRKINPVVNGITDLQRFAPVEEIKTKTPTVTMLSHVWYAKDIKTAILAADIIVNEWGFKDYQLDIYGAVDKAPAYTASCHEIISTKSLRQNVSLRGVGSPTAILEQTWVFLNSSISEGLPLALGEAALTGAPVVCTDVGASLRVLTDPQTNECYSAIVAPNDARALAKAQIHFLAMMGEWYDYSDRCEGTQNPNTGSSSSLPSSGLGASHSRELEDSTYQSAKNSLTTLPDAPTKKQVEAITKRMYEQTDARRRLGMRGREIVQKSFSGERYLREHEQMLWVGKAMKDMRHAKSTRESLSEEELAPAVLVENNHENYRINEMMDYHESMAAATTLGVMSNMSYERFPDSPSSRLTASGCTDVTGITPFEISTRTTMFTVSGESLAGKSLVGKSSADKSQWSKLQGQWAVPGLHNLQTV